MLHPAQRQRRKRANKAKEVLDEGPTARERVLVLEPGLQVRRLEQEKESTLHQVSARTHARRPSSRRCLVRPTVRLFGTTPALPQSRTVRPPSAWNVHKRASWPGRARSSTFAPQSATFARTMCATASLPVQRSAHGPARKEGAKPDRETVSPPAPAPSSPPPSFLSPRARRQPRDRVRHVDLTGRNVALGANGRRHRNARSGSCGSSTRDSSSRSWQYVPTRERQRDHATTTHTHTHALCDPDQLPCPAPSVALAGARLSTANL